MRKHKYIICCSLSTTFEDGKFIDWAQPYIGLEQDK